MVMIPRYSVQLDPISQRFRVWRRGAGLLGRAQPVTPPLPYDLASRVRNELCAQADAESRRAADVTGGR